MSLEHTSVIFIEWDIRLISVLSQSEGVLSVSLLTNMFNFFKTSVHSQLYMIR
jgi:hypothetical protein